MTARAWEAFNTGLRLSAALVANGGQNHLDHLSKVPERIAAMSNTHLYSKNPKLTTYIFRS